MKVPAQPDTAATQPDVLVVGSGITGLMTAYQMAQAGYQVRVLSKSPDPRQAALGTRFDSSTWDGYVNRYITLTEGHPYLDLPDYISVMYPEIGRDFQMAISQGGMLALPMEEWGELTQQFLHERIQANGNEAAVQQHFLTYLDENRASMELWYDLLTNAVRNNPSLSDLIALHSHGIDRFYDQANLYQGAAKAQQAQHVVKQLYTVAELLASETFKLYWPGLAGARFIRGGGLTMYGLAFDVQALAREWLLSELERLAVDLCFGPEFEAISIERTASGAVSGVKTQNGVVQESRHLFFHTGAYAHPQLFHGTAAYGKLAGVKGLWLRINHAERLFGHTPPRPNKIHGGKYELCLHGQIYRGQIADLNIMPKTHADGSWELVIGSGYLFVGLYPFEADLALGEPRAVAAQECHRQAQIHLAEELALRAFVQVVEQVYDLSIDLEAVCAGTDEYIDLPSKGCVRSWTPDDQELRVLLPTVQGGVLLIDGGGNTGSTTKAPFISKTLVALVQELDGEPRPAADFVANDAVAHRENLPLEQRYEALRRCLRKGPETITAAHWQALENRLNAAIAEGVSSASGVVA